MLLVVFNNLTDYGSNFAFVQKVLSMEDTFSGNQGIWRAVPNPLLHHIFYAGIIATEAAVALMCCLGTWQLWQYRRAEGVLYDKAKKWGIWGLTLGIMLWFLGFIAIGGEWFLMWQSQVWNGSEVAFRNAVMFLLVLIYLSQPQE